ncbi:hypothetical protein EC973_007182 [Apophysomyces ossiformis]|uniref:Uncharacterized protein n=1 Tax=Apophysomyces ossiformis TaxID=679940 RepID=A0A8H7EPZ4_9FUNG|nr:hypothetical protein EC973_007182 [Apophysomyces ossiformis]
MPPKDMNTVYHVVLQYLSLERHQRQSQIYCHLQHIYDLETELLSVKQDLLDAHYRICEVHSYIKQLYLCNEWVTARRHAYIHERKNSAYERFRQIEEIHGTIKTDIDRELDNLKRMQAHLLGIDQALQCLRELKAKCLRGAAGRSPTIRLRQWMQSFKSIEST